jgi:hypothetical protein
MFSLVIILWTICGTAAGHLLHSLSLAHKRIPSYPPKTVWSCLLFGPIALLVGILSAVLLAVEPDKKRTLNTEGK